MLVNLDLMLSQLPTPAVGRKPWHASTSQSAREANLWDAAICNIKTKMIMKKIKRLKNCYSPVITGQLMTGGPPSLALFFILAAKPSDFYHHHQVSRI